MLTQPMRHKWSHDYFSQQKYSEGKDAIQGS